MKCLTILNPFPAYILLPTSDPEHKRVENRKQWFSYRGPLLIHAGKDDRMMDPDQRYPGLDFHWGKIVGVCDLVDCVQLGHMSFQFAQFECTVNGQTTRTAGIDVQKPLVPPEARKKYPWLETHRHTHGPHCLILDNVRRFPEPVTCTGHQGLYHVKGVPLLKVKEQLKKAIRV